MATWKDVILTTRDLKQDYEVLDLICVVVAGNTWKGEVTALGLNLANGWTDQGYVDVLFQVASAKLRFQAHNMGATAVVGLEFDNSSDKNGNVIIGWGTAVKF